MRIFWEGILGPGWVASFATYVTITTAILIVGPLMMMLFTWIERRGIAFMQDRKGPNRVGPFGLFQPVAEAIKTITKEDITPAGADRWVHFLSPVVIMAATIMGFAVIPWGNLMTPAADLNIAVLYIVAIAAVHTVGILMAGWASNNKFSLLGGMRGVAQAISYEIPQVMSLIVVVMLVGSMSMRDIVLYQTGVFGLGWFVFTPVGLLGFLLFFISSLAEGERTPFDIPEAESELVAGYMTEYGGMKFAVFYLAQYMTNLAVCAVAAAVFLGGGAGPGSSIPVFGTLLSIGYFLAKTIALFFVMVWIRGTLPRLRVDQLMSFAWKFLLPLAIVNVFSAAVWVMLTTWGAANGVAFLDGLSPVVRTAAAYVLTAVINVAAFLVMVRVNTVGQRREVYGTRPSAA